MRIERIVTSNGIDNIKIIAEDDAEAVFVKQLAEAGTLSSLSSSASSSVIFKAISVQASAQTLNNQLISRGNIGKYDFAIRQNQNHNVSLTFVKNGIPLDLTDYSSIKLQVKVNKHSSPIVALEIASGLTVSGADNNILNVAFSSAQTKNLCNQEYYYDVLFLGDNSNIYYVEGKITINKTATR